MSVSFVNRICKTTFSFRWLFGMLLSIRDLRYMGTKQTISIKNILSPGFNIDDRFIPDYEELESVVDDLRRMGYRIVLTQGVYDLLHEGHASYLEKALSHGDILIVGVDSDKLTRERKGPTRPVVPERERLRMLAHLRHVSILTIRDVDHGIEKLINTVKPDILITSETTQDFPPEDIAKYEKVCGQIITLPAQATTSTTARIRVMTVEGADKLAKEITNDIPKLVKDVLKRMREGKD